MRRRLASLAVVAMLCWLSVGNVAAQEPEATGEASPAAASGFTYYKLPPEVCSGLGQQPEDPPDAPPAYSRDDCGFVNFDLVNRPDGAPVVVEFLHPVSGDSFEVQDATEQGTDLWRFRINPAPEWPAGEIDVRVLVDGVAAGESAFRHNALVAQLAPAAQDEPYRPGQDIPVTGTIAQVDTDPVTNAQTETPVTATFGLQVRTSDGEVTPIDGSFTAGPDGTFSATVPGSATAGVQAGSETNYQTTVAVEVVDASHDGGDWAAEHAGSGGVPLFTPPDDLAVENSFVSSFGWVKPGDTYPFRVIVRNYTDTPATGVTVTVAAPEGAVFNNGVALTDGQGVDVSDSAVTWTVGALAASQNGNPTSTTLVVEARAMTLGDDPRVVWKDLSSTATLTYDGYAGPALTSESHGPKVIPPDANLETARYGDKPFPMVPVDYNDRQHQDDNTGDALSTAVNDPDFPGSTFNLYQEMSYGQLYPEGTVPSAGIATADFNYEPGFDFTTPEATGTCRGYTNESVGDASYGSALYPERIVNGWYQLPGNTEYYGGDYPVFDLGTASSIDSACGQLGKAVYDGAQIADPEIDYNEYDSDKDGVVDFFMLVFVGCGGNGASQIAVGTPATNDLCPLDDVPYDNIWPHSSSLEMQYRDAETGLRGYISDDQLNSLEEIPQCWLDDSRTAYDDCAAEGGPGDDNLPVYVRVGPYNVNPETSIDSASVISHEYGHHLGLPDFYSSQSLYADLNLMASDFSQHMTIFSKQDLGWVVPRFAEPGESIPVEEWSEIKADTGEIRWQTVDGEDYTLSESNGDQNVHNGEAYGFKLPTRQLIDPAKVAEQTAQPGSNVWWSERGNDFGCSPDRGHNLDVYLPELSEVEAGTPITVTFKSSWDIEWDWDYGFVLSSVDGETYVSNPSENGYTTSNTYNPNGQQCFTETNNGLTGQSGAYEQGEPTVTQARNPVANEYHHGSPFLEDTYDISELAGATQPVLRFSYFTDAAFDRPGWFIDDVVVTAGDEVIYESNFESGDEAGRLFPGGCEADGGFSVARQCTAGWVPVDAEEGSQRDHAYYLELRDQSQFDFNGWGQSDRGDTSWDPGVFIEYTDETHGYGNNGVPMPPAQHYLDSQPVPGSDCGAVTNGNCADASFTAAAGDRHFDDSVDADQPEGWVDNFSDPGDAENVEKYGDENWHFDYDCLSLDVTSMTGEDPGPDPTGTNAPADLTADAVLKAGQGCRQMQYFAGGANQAPTAVAQARPRQGRVGDRFTFDASRSYDDLTALEDLKFRWDVDGDGFDDGSRQTITHRYRTAGTKTARLRVEDAQGLRSVDTVTVEVAARNTGGGRGGDDGDDGDDGDVGDNDDDRRDSDRADRGGDRTPRADVGDVAADDDDRGVGAVANTGAPALAILAAALLALTLGFLCLTVRTQQRP